MTKLLHIISAPREEKSRTLQVSAKFLQKFHETHPACEVDELNLAKESLPSLSIPTITGKYELLSGKELSQESKKAWQSVLKHIERFLSAEIYLISAPMWNFGIPYMLKQYIDIIVQPKYLFQYTKNGVEGLAKNKKMVVISSRGGEYSSPTNRPLDFEEPYLRTIFGFVGITDITFINAEPLDMGEEKKKQALDQAQERAKAVAMQI